MPSYHYEALKISDRSKIKGLINATSEKDAREQLRQQDLIPTNLSVLSGENRAVKNRLGIITDFIGQFTNVSAKDKLVFTRNIEMMLRAGIPLTEALLYLETYTKAPKFKKIIKGVRKDILSGSSFSQALSRHKKTFDNVYVNVTKAGEASGELESALRRLTDLIERAEKLKMKIIAASVYPCVVMFIVAIVLLVMFLFVLPTFTEIYQRMGVPLPFLTKMMLGISHLLRDYWYIMFPIMGFSIFGFFKYLSSAGGKLLLDTVSLHIPVLGDLLRLMNNSHFLSTFSVSFAAGLPITEAISLASETIHHSQMRGIFQKVRIKIESGQRLAPALEEYQASNQEKELLFPDNVEKQKAEVTLFNGKGCDVCGKTGFLGRIALFEILIFDRQIRQMISQGKLDLEIKDTAITSGMNTLAMCARQKVLQGETTLKETIRVLGMNLED